MATKKGNTNSAKTIALSLDHLLQATKNNEYLDLDSPARIDYGFANCVEEEDEENLLHVYTTIIQVYKCNTTALHEASSTGKLAQFIEAELTKAKQIDQYFGQWFMEHKDLVNNSKTK